MSIVPEDAEEPGITGGAFVDVKDTISPFGFQRCEGVDLVTIFELLLTSQVIYWSEFFDTDLDLTSVKESR